MNIGDIINITMSNQALRYNITGRRGVTNITYDVTCIGCGQRTSLHLGNETQAQGINEHVVNVNDIQNSLTRTQVIGHRRRCWRQYFGATTPRPLQSVSTTVTGTTGTTGPGSYNPIHQSRRQRFVDQLKDKALNKKRKKKIKLPEFRLIRDD